MLKVGNGIKITLPLSQVVFASSSEIEDRKHFASPKGNYPLLEKRQVVISTSVEQLLELLHLESQHVYTDRYHPGVVVQILGVPFSTLSYPAEPIKLKGLAELTATKTPRERNSLMVKRLLLSTNIYLLIYKREEQKKRRK
jgi:hypothetical protein